MLLNFILICLLSVASTLEVNNVNINGDSDLRKNFSRAQIAAFEPPQYMLDLYNQVVRGNDRQLQSSLLHGATIVRSIPSKGFHRGCAIFTLGEISEGEKVQDAEFHFHFHLPHRRQNLIPGDQVFVRLSIRCFGEDGEKLGSFSEYVGRHSDGWKKIPIGKALSREGEGKRNIVLVIEASTLNGTLIYKLHRHRRHANPFLVLFIESSDLEFQDSIDQLKRTKRSVERGAPMLESCGLRPLKVDFNKIGWSSWIIAPLAFNAFQCVGSCQFPLVNDENITNHAIVVSAIHAMGSSVARESPSCVPTAYDDLAILLYDENGVVSLRRFPRMVATSCGCR